MTLARLYVYGFVFYGALVVGGMVVVARLSHAGPHTRLTHEVAENQWIDNADLASIDEADIAQHYALRHMASGDTITPNDVARTQQTAPKPTLAVLASYARERRPKPLMAGDMVRLCLDGVAVTPDAIKVASVACDATTCSATLPLSEVPKPLQDKDAAARLRLVDESNACGGK
ncbi:MAG: hypothetical protein ACLPGW_19245 [Roseiarcus sp.]